VLRRAHGAATALFVAHLGASTAEASAARAALDERAMPLAAVTAYQLGLAPASWTALTDHLRSHGYDDQQLLDSGLALRSRRGTLVDRFRDRLIFPVHDGAGDVVGFLGRALNPDERTPRYLNTPETALYRKREVLYGLGTEGTRAALAAGAHPVLVEGAFDAIAVTCAGAGRYVGVAPSGTSLTQDQVEALHAVVPLHDREVVVGFDGDAAGRAAAVRSYDVLRERGAWPLHLPLPEGQDPASLSQSSGPEALRLGLDAAQPLADLVIDERLARWADKVQWGEGRIGSMRAAAPVIAVLPADQALRQVRRVASVVGVELSAMVAEVVRVVSPDVATDAARPGCTGCPCKWSPHGDPPRGQQSTDGAAARLDDRPPHDREPSDSQEDTMNAQLDHDLTLLSATMLRHAVELPLTVTSAVSAAVDVLTDPLRPPLAVPPVHSETEDVRAVLHRVRERLIASGTDGTAATLRRAHAARELGAALVALDPRPS